MRPSFSKLGSRLLVGCFMTFSSSSPAQDIDDVPARLMTSPAIETAAGFMAEILVAPGKFYDPLWLHSVDGAVWLNDDGGEEGEWGGRLFSIERDGAVSILVGLGRLLPATGFDVAPASFGSSPGFIHTVAQGRVGAPGTMVNHVIQRVDPDGTEPAETLCTLPAVNDTPRGQSGLGIDARFGPKGTPFEGRFFAITALNNTIYQMDVGGICTPFVTFDGAISGTPTGLAFSPDGRWMLVALTLGGLKPEPGGEDGVIIRVSPEGEADGTPVAVGLGQPIGIAFAPADFAPWGGQMFVSDLGAIQAPVPMTRPLDRDGRIFRVSEDGKVHLVASGFVNPAGVLFVEGSLWVADFNGDFIGGRRELPEGFIVKITPEGNTGTP